ncbi:energy-coupling factor ABC transporter ATP-binding protein [Desulfurobacterium atlanticum]|uniref:Cobalt/nickel transport system ATP-binding protein n=1 Tax=Desulfurobacterium atlanticum TaxID=240169 RepID=A0A238XVC7_9BACT|nr:ABC transporter ATP-binding protein [Desulfurobacterium atlanticum]SNR62284.1 cobalt/nickel transport system ATP-binding protein [Desulfurobacterium atlanticum]
MEILKIENLSVKRDGKFLFQNINLTINQGEKFFLTGPNGAGKTTLIETIMGFVKPISGKILFKGKEIKTEKDLYRFRISTGYVFQNPDDQLFSPTVEEDIAFGLLNIGIDREKIPEIIDTTLKMLDIHYLKNKLTFKLSGGEKRLVSIASVLAMNPEWFVMDEPTTGVDNEKLELLLQFLKTTPKTTLIITHDKDMIEELKWPVFRLEKGKLFRVF